MVGGACDDGFGSCEIVVYVLASARLQVGGKSRLARDVGGHSLMLVVDECHKAGAASSSRIFDAATTCRLGLSATPLREGADSQDELGQVLPLERQRHGRALGSVCYRLSLRDGYERGMLPRYEIHHHGISLTAKEQGEYSLVTHRVSQARQEVSRCGGSPESYLGYLSGRSRASGALRSAAGGLQVAYLERKHFLYQASERLRVVERVLVQAWQDERLGPPQGAVLFNERIGEALPSESAEGEGAEDAELATSAETLYTRIAALAGTDALPFPPRAVALEHSKKSAAHRQAALAGLRAGTVQVLVSVKALQEGIDIPDVGLGISVASTASARQRIQTMGRILRPARDSEGQRIPADQSPVKRLHLLYVRGTADEEIYRRTDWNDETGADRNHWWTWGLKGDAPKAGDELAPIDLDETTAWERIKDLPLPQPWSGPTNGLPFVHKQGSVFVLAPSAPLPVQDGEELIALLQNGKRSGAYPDARGRFRVSSDLHVLLKRAANPSDPSTQVWLALGRVPQAPVWASAPDEPADPTPARLKSKTPTRSGPARSWYVLLQEGFLAAATDDPATLKAVCEELRGKRKAWAYEALATLADPQAPAPPATDTPPKTLEVLVPFVAQAYASGRKDLVRRAAEGFNVGKAKKAKRVAVHNALAILAGQSQSVLLAPSEGS
jgi:hypothetical protein